MSRGDAEAPRCRVELTENFERNLAQIADFLQTIDAPEAFDRLLDDLTETLIPNLARFPDLGGSFNDRSVASVEVVTGKAKLQEKISAIGRSGQLREYVFPGYLVLYARFDATIYLLSIRHQRQLSFDFASLWTD